MREIRRSPFRPAPWGRKRYYAPLPILSVLLLATVVAKPDILRTDFLLYQDSGLTIVARVSQVVHLSGPSGTIVGTMQVTNTHSFGIRVLLLGATILSVTGSAIVADIGTAAGRLPVSVDAGSTVSVPFKGTFSGDLTSLSVGQQFSVTPTVSWMEVYATGDVGPFSYTQPKTCTIPDVVLTSPEGGEWVAICS